MGSHGIYGFGYSIDICFILYYELTTNELLNLVNLYFVANGNLTSMVTVIYYFSVTAVIEL